ncbi:MAG: selenocysteine lyase/cysteine desulfurase [Thalassolituus oleivorans]|jgi:selenocysteine lyase/cysteine desulfurase
MASRRSFLKTAAMSVPALTRFPTAQGPARFPDPDHVSPGDFWEEIGKLYTLSPSRIYLNTGGLGPAPDPVLKRFREETDRLQTLSETGHNLFDPARETVASFFGADPDEVAFTRNATEGNATVAAGLRLTSGDEIIIDASAHPGGAIPWLNQLKRNGVRVRTFQPDSIRQETTLERIEALISDRTRVIQISHVTAPTGILLPAKRIAQIAASHGVWFHIDGAQSAGMLPIDLHDIGCDSYATSGHKWLGAPHGTGILFIRKARLDDVWPTEVGAYSDAGYHLPDTLEYVPTARRHESGTRNAPLVAAVAEAVSFMSRIGMEILTPEPDPMRGSILTFRSEKMAYSELNQALGREHHLRLRVVTEQNLNAIRVSMHVFNSEEHVDRVIEGVRDVLG